ncbi:MAG TPA: hypothetical protein VFK94_06460 [Patescibacteria group bacterium]|nr:hypothetical protein [Patescibacteria group bacterium]
MAETNKRLHGPAQVSNAAATKYTVPAGTKTLVRHVHISNPSANAVTFTMSIGADAAAVRLFDAYSIPAGTVFDWFPFMIIDATEIIQALAGTNNILVLEIFGTEYTL